MLVSFCISKGDGAKLSGITIVHINYFRYYRVLEYLLNYSAEYSTPKLLVSGSPNDGMCKYLSRLSLSSVVTVSVISVCIN